MTGESVTQCCAIAVRLSSSVAHFWVLNTCLMVRHYAMLTLQGNQPEKFGQPHLTVESESPVAVTDNMHSQVQK